MKKISILATLAMGLFLFSSCESDRDDNPTLSVPQAINLLTPEIGDNVINLKNSESVQFKAEAAPNYSFPTETSYWIQLTEAKDFSDPSKVQSTDTKGKAITYDAPANEIDLGIMKLRGYEKPEDVDTTEVITLNVRMVSSLSNATDSSTYVYSNTKTIKVNPYFLKESLPNFWYMIGSVIGDGSWAKADVSDGVKSTCVGKSMLPMYVKAGESYNRFTGDGVIQYIGYFPSGGIFKILTGKFDWNYGMGGGDLATGGFKYRDNDSDPGNINIASAGYYNITIDTKAHEMKSEVYKPDSPIKKYTSMKVGDNDMAAVSTYEGCENHDWYALLTFSSASEMKFTSNDGTAWGTNSFPCGLATTDGDNIPVKAGTYKVFFNDITGAYMFIEQK